MAASIPKLQLESVRTVPPTKPTDPREPISVHIEENPSSAGILKRCFNVVLCYNQKRSTSATGATPACGSLVAALIRESLAIALSEQPMLAGRLKRGDSGEFELVPNDSGIRLVEMDMGMSLNEFLDLKVKNDAESQLVFWEDLDHEHNPQYSPLFYVQVTNFSCGGYSIGISCSILVTDPFSQMSFLKKWTDIHLQMVSNTDSHTLPYFYRPHNRINAIGANSPSLPFGTNTKTPNAGKSAIFTIKSSDLGSRKPEEIAAICINEVGGIRDSKDLNFSSVLVKELTSRNDVKVHKFPRNDLYQIENQKVCLMNNGDANWDDSGGREMCFQEGNKPVYVSCWISSVPDEAFLMMVDHDSGIKAVITLPV